MPISPISGDYTVGKGLVFFKPKGQSYFEELGDVDNFDLTIDVEEIERKSNQFGVATLANSSVIEVGATVETTLYQMTNRNRALAVASDKSTMAQTQASGETLTVTGVKAGGIYEIPALSLSNVTVDDGESSPVSYTEGTDYEIDLEAGLIKVMQIPATAGSDMVVTYDQGEISEGLKAGIGANPNIRGHLRLRGVNDIGVRVLVDIWDVQLRPSGARSYIGNDYTQVGLTGQAFADSSQPTDYRLGMERTL